MQKTATDDNMTTRDEIRQIAQEAADAAVSQCLLKIGINTEDPEAVIKFQGDLNDLRGMASFFRDMKNKGAIAAWLMIITAIVGCVWVGIKSSLH